MTIKSVQFLSDTKDLERRRREWEHLYDAMVAAARKLEPRIPWETVKHRLNGRQKRRS